MAFFNSWLFDIICLGLAYYFYKNPVDDKDPLLYALLIICAFMLKMATFAYILAP